MNLWKKIDENLEVYIIVPLLIGMSFLIFFQVIMRYVFQSSLIWSEELSRYLFIWLVYISVSYTAKQEKHIRIDAAFYLFPKHLRPYVELFSDILILVFSVFIVFTSVTVVGKIAWSGQMSPALHLHMEYVYLATLVGFVLTTYRTLQTIHRKVKNFIAKKEAN
ncbi:MAG: TRAP transporter small permease [Bacillota bacterium]